MFLSLTVNKNICCALVTDNTPYKTLWQSAWNHVSKPDRQIKKFTVQLVLLIIYTATPITKEKNTFHLYLWRQSVQKHVFKPDHQINIFSVIFVAGNIGGWPHHNTIFSDKMKYSTKAYEYMNSLKIPSTVDS